MTRGHRRLVAVGAVALALGASGVGGAPAAAEDLGVAWEGEFGDPAFGTAEASGETLAVPVRFEYSGAPNAVITDITLELRAVGTTCDTRFYNHHLADGAEDRPSTRPPTTVATAEWTFQVDPGCNGTYDVFVTAVADHPGPNSPVNPPSQSGPLVRDDLRVSLRPPAPTGVAATVGAERDVTVRWTAPASWAPAPPRDARGYRVQRTAADGTVAVVADGVAPAQTSVVDTGARGAPAGRYRYEVVALRGDARGVPLASQPGASQVELGAPGAPATTASPPATSPAVAAAGGVPAGGFVPALPAPAPAVPAQPGYSPELDYSRVQPAVDVAAASVPDESGLFDVGEETTGAGLLLPGAVGLCLLVWAGHLRHLARQAAPPLR